MPLSNTAIATNGASKTGWGEKLDLDTVKRTFHRWLFLEDDTLIDIALATWVANLYRSDPVWTIIIGPPSHAKTEVLRAFDKHVSTYSLSTLTPKTLLSGFEGKKGSPESSLIYKLTNKLVIIKDFTSILSLRAENRGEIMGQLREIYDGYLSKDVGTGKHVRWDGRIGLLGACTPVWDRHYGVISTLGDRFLLYRINCTNLESLANKASEVAGKEDQMRAEIMEVTHSFLSHLSNNLHLYPIQNKLSIDKEITQLAIIASICRTHVDRDQFRKEVVSYQPMAEGPGRLTKQLKVLCSSLMAVHQINCPTEHILSLLRRVVRHCMSSYREQILYHLWFHNAYGKHYLTTSSVANALNIPRSTAHGFLEDMSILGILGRSTETVKQSRTESDTWKISSNFKKHITKSTIFQ